MVELKLMSSDADVEIYRWHEQTASQFVDSQLIDSQLTNNQLTNNPAN
jgi:hypothetical protein